MKITKKRIEQAAALMTAFAERTGLTSGATLPRYLWTDAFAVCNFLALARATGDETYRDLALDLVEGVHETLGRHRADDPRAGWLSGLHGEAARAHPTRGGLRIGKRLPERGPDEPFDQHLEWERDGQYFHYLTKWMHALDLMARATEGARFARWARELLVTATKAFVYQISNRQPRMVWKVSIDLSRPLVASMGHHDPLDGYITAQQLLATAEEFGSEVDPSLGDALNIFARMVSGRDWSTTDPLGLGGLMMDAVRLAQLIRRGKSGDLELLVELLRSAGAGIHRWSRSGNLEPRAGARLAFRELGLAIGLRGLRWLGSIAAVEDSVFTAGSSARTQFHALGEHLPLGERILSFWLEPANMRSRTWKEHEDINTVMLATALAPQGFLQLPALDAGE